MNYIAGIDIGGTKCATLIAEAGVPPEFLSRREFATEGKPAEVIERFCKNIIEQAAEIGIGIDKIGGVGISCGGPLDSGRGVILSPPNLPGWDEIEIVKMIETRLGISAALKNDADACALAEHRYGAGRGTRNMVFLTFGTGCGAGLILDGRLYSGTNGFAGELGHWRMSASGPVGYNKKGSLEGFCSGGGMARLAVVNKDKFKNSKLYPACADKTVTAKDITLAARADDAYALWLFEKSGTVFGKALSLVIDFLNPELIVAGGVFMRAFDLFIPHVQKQIKKDALPASAARCRIAPSLLGDKIGDYGAIGAFDK